MVYQGRAGALKVSSSFQVSRLEKGQKVVDSTLSQCIFVVYPGMDKDTKMEVKCKVRP